MRFPSLHTKLNRRICDDILDNIQYHTMRFFADKYNIGVSTVWKIVHGKIYIK